MMNERSQRSDFKKINLIEGDKKQVSIKHNKNINNSLKLRHKIKSYSLKCKKDTENMNPKSFKYQQW